ncbi:MAG: hypothetical protein ACOCTI_02945 [Phycisphaeraceae bacterium]
MTPMVPLALLAFLPLTLVLFSLMRPTRAAVAALVLGTLFLPQAELSVEGFVDYGKAAATALPILLATAWFAPDRLRSFRPGWVDLPMALWCLVPAATSLANNLGLWDALAGVVYHVRIWGLAWLVGRIYLRRLEDLRELAGGVIIGALLYLPFFLYELRMSPQLHRMVYGFHPSQFVHAVRYGGYRPMIFMPGGIDVAMWFGSALILALMFWRGGLRDRYGPLAMIGLVVVLAAATVLAKSVGVIMLTAAALGLYASIRLGRTRIVLLIAVAAIPLYLGARVADWHGEGLVDIIASQVDATRAASLETRLDNEAEILEEKWGRAILGWGGWGRNLVSEGRGSVSITDSLWIIAFGKFGLIGLAAVFSVMLLPLGRVLSRVRPDRLLRASAAPALGLCLATWMFAADKLVNAWPNPVFIAVMAGLATTAPAWQRAGARKIRKVVAVEPAPAS